MEGDRRYNVVIGFVESAKNRAELRSYELLHKIYQRRHGRPFDMVETEFERLTGDIQAFADTQGIAMYAVNTLAQLERTKTTDGHERRGLLLRHGVMLVLGVLLLGLGLGHFIGR